MNHKPVPTGVERCLGHDEIIVSKTDPRGRITYVNKVFLTISGYSEEEAIGRPHSFVRHPEMPRSVFKLLWETILDGNEIFAYVVNLCKNGDHYWVLAHVTPTFADDDSIVGFHSNRRAPSRVFLPQVIELYARLIAEEQRHSRAQESTLASTKLLQDIISKDFRSYDEYIHSIVGA